MALAAVVVSVAWAPAPSTVHGRDADLASYELRIDDDGNAARGGDWRAVWQDYRPGDRGRAGRALRAHVERWFGVTVPEVHPASDSAAEGNEVVAVEEVLRWSHPTGDLDGDGRDDVYVVEFDSSNESASVTALRGVDGSVLWRRDGDDLLDLVPVPVSDLTGDGAPDLLAFWFAGSWSWEEQCARTPLTVECSFNEEAELVWELALVSGATGDTHWSQRQPGGWRYEGHYDATGPRSVSEVSGSGEEVLLLPIVSPDVDGDARSDLIVNHVEAFSYAYGDEWVSADPAPADASRSNEELTVRGSVELRDAATGSVRSNLLLWDGPEDRFAFPAGDLAGTSAADLIVEEWTYPHHDQLCVDAFGVGHCHSFEGGDGSFDLVAFDVEAGAELWRRPLGPYYLWSDPAGADVDGDGSSDLFVESLTDDFGADHAVWNGRTGEEVWRVGTDGGSLLAVDDLDGDDLEDVLLVEYIPEEDDVALELVRLRGHDGHRLLSTSRRVASDGDGWAWLWVVAGLDADGDGDGDILTEFGWSSGSGSSSGGQVERLDDGAVLSSWVDREIRGLGDFDGDGGTDALFVPLGAAGEIVCEEYEDEDGWWYDCTWMRPEKPAPFSATRLGDLSTIWTRDVDLVVEWLAVAGDLLGRGGNDVIHEEWVDGTVATITALRGDDLAELWAFR